MDLLEESTPVAESKDFGVEPMMTSMQTLTPTSDASSGTSDAKSKSPSDSSDSADPQKEDGFLGGEAPKYERDRMSESYHEIFDTQMPPERVLAELQTSTDNLDAKEHNFSDELSALCADTESTTRYLTSKLVEDSLKWQHEQSVRGAWPSSGSPFGSPLRRRPQNLSLENIGDDLKENLTIAERNQILDPTAILEIERHAKYLATSVDSLIENLSGILQSISALTVDTLETYRDAVCKTCDQVDTNIKSMYQLMAKVEELNKSMAPAYKLADQVKEVKRLLAMFESATA